MSDPGAPESAGEAEPAGRSQRARGASPPAAPARSPARRRWLTPTPGSRRVTPLLAAVLLLFLLAPACTLTVRPPTRPHDPVTVWIVDHGRHASLALPDGEGHLVAWAYGEDAWFARNQDGFWRIVPAMLWSTRGTLGRRQVTESTSGHLLAWTLDAEWIWKLEVPRERAADLQHELQSLFDAGIAEQIDNPTYKARFAPHPDGYWIGHTCIDELEEWLEALDCEVSGFALTADFEVRGGAVQPWAETSDADPLFRGPSPAPPEHLSPDESPPPPATLEEAIEETLGGLRDGGRRSAASPARAARQTGACRTAARPTTIGIAAQVEWRRAAAPIGENVVTEGPACRRASRRFVSFRSRPRSGTTSSRSSGVAVRAEAAGA